MSARNTIWIERVGGKVVRIFKGTHSEDWKQALEAGTLETCPRRDAVSAIWESLWVRAAGKCEYCGVRITRTGWTKGEMHEEIHRSLGGEISLVNSKMVCKPCHRDTAHGDRKLRWKSFEEAMGEDLDA
jgi:5-methylcytosine-specific restriction endonuclease McrA